MVRPNVTAAAAPTAKPRVRTDTTAIALSRASAHMLAANQIDAETWCATRCVLRVAPLVLRSAHLACAVAAKLGWFVGRLLRAWWVVFPPALHRDWLWQLGRFSGHAVRVNAAHTAKRLELSTLIPNDAVGAKPATSSIASETRSALDAPLILVRPNRAADGGSHLEQWFSVSESRTLSLD